MFKSLLALSLCAMAASVAAQVTSPPGYLSTEGAYRSNVFGTLPDYRAQVVDGEYRGKVLVVKEIGFRQESNPYSTVNTQRAWSNVTLQVAKSDFASMSSTFTSNFLSTPTTVYSGATTWPGVPTNQTVPQAWEKQLAFPFKSAIILDGKTDPVYDFTFTGGTLANKASWRSPVDYNLDTYVNTDQVPATINKYTTTNGCVDSGATWTQAGWSTFVATAYGPGWSTVSWRNQMRVSLQAFRTGPNVSIVHVVDFTGVPAGTNFPGISCQKLYIPVNPGAVLFTSTASASGLGAIVYPSNTANGLVPYKPYFAGYKLWTQAAWEDSKTKSLLLTDASEATMPLLPTGAPKHKTSFSRTSTGTSGDGPADANYANRIFVIR